MLGIIRNTLMFIVGQGKTSNHERDITKLTFTFSKSTIKALEKCMK